VAWTLSSSNFRPKSISWSMHQARHKVNARFKYLKKTRTRKLQVNI